jgi:hypothetical protein
MVPSLQDIAAYAVYSRHSVDSIRDANYPSEVVCLVECAKLHVWKTYDFEEQHVWEDVASTCTNSLHLVHTVYIDFLQKVYGKSSKFLKLMHSICPYNHRSGYYKLQGAFSGIAYDIFNISTHAWHPHGKYQDPEDPWYQKTEDAEHIALYDFMVYDSKKRKKIMKPEFKSVVLNEVRRSIEAARSAHIAISCLNENPFIASKLLRYKRVDGDFVTRFLSKLAIFIQSGEELSQSLGFKKQFRV